jgi:curli biogenesis system outer membrane secretion channel CsgG
MEDVQHAGLVFSLIVLLCGCVSTSNNQHGNSVSYRLNLDSAILEGSKYLGTRIPVKSKIAVLSIQSPKANLGNYVTDCLSVHLVNQEQFVVIERSELENIQKEQKYQLSGEVSDETAVSVGRQLGTQIIITGSIMPLGYNYSLRLKVTNVETAQIIGTQMYTVRPDNVLLSLLNSPDQNTDEIADETQKQIHIDNVNITNNNTTTINGDVYVNMPGW